MKLARIHDSRQQNLLLDFQPQNYDDRPFARSLRLLLDATVRENGAHAAFLYELDENERTLHLRVRSGPVGRRLENARIELSPAATQWLEELQTVELLDQAPSNARVGSFPEVILHGLHHLAVAPLRTNQRLVGIVTLGWRTAASGQKGDDLQSLALAAGAILERARQSNVALHLAAQVTKLEAELADLKIAERSGGILADTPAGSQAPARISDHVHRVLSTIDAATVLRQQVDALKAQLQDRRVLAQAKEVLQRTFRMSEEQAYIHLRNTSRRERRPLKEIAGEVIQAESRRERATA